MPGGYRADHPLADDLRLTAYYVMEPFTEREVCGRGFMDRFVAVCRRASPLMEFLTTALGLPW